MHSPHDFEPDFTFMTEGDYNDLVNSPTLHPKTRDIIIETLNTKIQYLGNDKYRIILKDFEIDYNMSMQRLISIKDIETNKIHSCNISCYYKSETGKNLDIELFSVYPVLMVIKAGEVDLTIYYFDNQFFIPFSWKIYKKIEVENLFIQSPVKVSVSRFYGGSYKQAVKMSIENISYLITFNDTLTKVFSVCVLEDNMSKEFDYCLKGKTKLLEDKLTNLDHIITYGDRELTIRLDIWRYEKLSKEEAKERRLLNGYLHFDLPKISLKDKDGSVFDIHQIRDYNKFEVRDEMKNKISIDHVERRPIRQYK